MQCRAWVWDGVAGRGCEGRILGGNRTEDLDFLLKNLTAGTTISVYVIAANEGGEAAPSATVTKVVGS